MALAGYTAVIVTYNRKGLLQECIRCMEAQTAPADKIVIVDNASTDGTGAYLAGLAASGGVYCIVDCPHNVGGAGGFARGLAQAVRYGSDCILLIDDDAMLAPDYMERLLQARSMYPEYGAFAGSVYVNGQVDATHRRDLSRAGLFFRDCPASLYQGAPFVCDIASFCGMLVERVIVEKIGLPHEEYFIWHDDAEYSLRIRAYSRFLVVPGAALDHRTSVDAGQTHPRRYGWRDYYAVRNRIWMLEEHGSAADRILGGLDLFGRVIVRNWLFGLVRAGGHDWKYEKRLAAKACKDARLCRKGHEKRRIRQGGTCTEKESHL